MPYDVSCHVHPDITLIGEPDVSLNIVASASVNIQTAQTVEQENQMTVVHACRTATTVSYTHAPQFTVQVNGSQEKTIQGATSSGSKTVITTN